jgi:hypothetical protein
MKLITAKQLGDIIEVKPKTLYLWAATRQIPSVLINGLVRFDLDEVLKWIQANQKSKSDADQETMAKRRRKGRQN